MSAPSWYRCKACGASDTTLFANPPCPVARERRPLRGYTSAYQLVCDGCVLWCYDHWKESSAQDPHGANSREPLAVQEELWA